MQIHHHPLCPSSASCHGCTCMLSTYFLLFLITLPSLSDCYPALNLNSRSQSSSSSLVASNSKDIKLFRFKDCGRRDRAVKVEYLNVFPMPITLPGFLNIKFIANLTRRIPQIVDVEMSMKKRYLSWMWQPVPCIHEYGSCYYENVNVCEAAKEFDYLEKCSNITPKRYSLGQAYMLPDVGRAISRFLEGDYKATLRVHHPFTQEELACVSFQFTIAAVNGSTNDDETSSDYGAESNSSSDVYHYSNSLDK